MILSINKLEASKMGRNLAQIAIDASTCHCGNQHFEIITEKVLISPDAIMEAANYMVEKNYNLVTIIADDITFKVAGQLLSANLREKGLSVEVSIIKPDDQNDIAANEVSIIQALLETSNETNVLLAVGSGTIHDITRFVSYKMGKPFISIPTAPSVDGFNSMGAPLVIQGEKKTFQTQAPIAVFADLTVLKKAPKKMIAAGFGDMLGKYTSLADWRFGSLIGGESFCPIAASITDQALQSCVNYIDQIAEGDEEGIQKLMEGLIQSGFAMLLIGQSYPASGAEHHLSHYWEMDFIKSHTKQVLHGAKVSLACGIIASLYQNKFKNIILELDGNSQNHQINKVYQHKREVEQIIDSIPSSERISSFIAKLGGITSTAELGVSNELIHKSLKEAHLIRDRYTMLRFLNEEWHYDHK
jgi:glycerol-1-phosphate dehydrogenase [NAD(P)+]